MSEENVETASDGATMSAREVRRVFGISSVTRSARRLRL
jgi:hypothetical protein